MASSRFSTVSATDTSVNHTQLLKGLKKTVMDSAMAEATRITTEMLQRGQLKTREAYEAEWTRLYHTEYYKLMNIAKLSIVYSQNKTIEDSPEKFPTQHTVVRFTRRNFFIHVKNKCITVAPMSYLTKTIVDSDLEMCDMFLSAWPGPLHSLSATEGIINYITTLQQNEFQRKKIFSHDDQKTIIWNLLMKMILQHGNVSGLDMAEMLLDPGDTKINEKDEAINKFIKQLLLGKRKSAIAYAVDQKLWAHAQCLSFLDEYHPFNSSRVVTKDPGLLDDPIVSLNSKFIADLESQTLVQIKSDQTKVQIDLRPIYCLYRALLNQKLKKWDQNSLNQIPVVSAKDSYLFAILISNECEIVDIDYDTTSELFKLIVAIRNKDRNHVINFGQLSDDSRSDDLSYRSLVSFVQTETVGSRVQTISSPELLILNEVWEFARNLSVSQNNYEYLINLVPYKMVFASKLLDYGMTHMCHGYISAIREAFDQLAHEKIYGSLQIEDTFYDWDAIRSCVNYLAEVCAICDGGRVDKRPINNNYESLHNYAPEHQSINSIENSLPIHNMSLHMSHPHPNNDLPYDSVDRNLPEPILEEEGFGESKEPTQEVNNDILEDRYRPPLPEYQPPPFHTYHQPIHEEEDSEANNSSVHYGTNRSEPAISSPTEPQMTTSSPIQDDTTQHNYMDNPMNSFGPLSPISPMNEYNNGQMEPITSRNSFSNEKKAVESPKESHSGDQQPASSLHSNIQSMFSKVASSILPQNKAKPMILPKDNSMYYDNNLKRWVDSTNPDAANNAQDLAPPPMIPINSQGGANYTFGPRKSYKPSNRYPSKDVGS